MININDLAYACQLYGKERNYDLSYINFLESINHYLDLINPLHRKSLLIWLNKWGCRQFATKYHELASEEILKWYKDNRSILPKEEINIWELKDNDLDLIQISYKNLKDITASFQKRKTGEVKKHAGPTGASKILFAFRPKSLIPWDGAIRNDFGEGDSGLAYIVYIKKVNETIKDLMIQCRKNNFEIEELPKKINRPFSTIPKLIDEYSWVTNPKRGLTIPKIDFFK
jgi:hypothetical protein